MRTKRGGVVYFDRTASAKVEYNKLAKEWLTLRERKHYAGGYGGDWNDDFIIGLNLRMIEIKSRMNVLAKMYGHKW